MLHAARLDHAGGPDAPNRPRAPAALVTALWIATLVYSVVQRADVRHALGDLHGRDQPGGRRDAVHRLHGDDEPGHRLLSATWQGIAIEALGYPQTLLIDVIIGLACLVACCRSCAKPGAPPATTAAPVARARRLAGALGLLCVAWLPYRAGRRPRRGGSRSSRRCSRWSSWRRRCSCSPGGGARRLGAALARVGAGSRRCCSRCTRATTSTVIAGWFSAASPEPFTRGGRNSLFRGSAAGRPGAAAARAAPVGRAPAAARSRPPTS